MMRSREETERLTKVARLEGKLQRPENKLNALRLLQVLIVKEIHNAKTQMGLIEARFEKLQEAHAVEGIRNEAIEKQLEEVRKDKASFSLLLSEAKTTTQDTKDGLESLREKVSDEFFKLTADNARFSKDIKTLNRQVGCHQGRLGVVEEALDGFCAKVAESREEVTKLNDTLSRLEPMVKSMYGKLDGISSVTMDQKEALRETVNDHARIRQFLDSFVPRQEEFFHFLEKLPEANSSAALGESLWGNSNHPASSASFTPQPPPKAHQMLEQYNHFSSSYRFKRPKSEARFIRAFLKKIDHRAAWLIQIKLHQEYPDLACQLEGGAEISRKRKVIFFISFERLCWEHVKAIMRGIDGKQLFKLLEAEEGPDTETDIPPPQFLPQHLPLPQPLPQPQPLPRRSTRRAHHN